LTPELPAELSDRFEPLAVLGSGSFGLVVRAHDRRLGREVAVKLLTAAFTDPGAAGRFRREAQATARLQHPSIVKIFDHGLCADGQRFLVFELVEGRVLREFRGEAGPQEVRRWGAGLASALAEAHDAGILHRDVKPSNVVVDEAGRARLLDFGLARSSGQGTAITATGVLVGTPNYLPPEVIDGAAFTEASDQFALAVTLYEVASGAPAFRKGRLQRLVAGLPPDLPLPAPELEAADPELHATLCRAMAPDPADRWPHCEALGQALARPRARRSTVSQDRPPPSRGYASRVLASVLMASVGALGFLWSQGGPPPPSRGSAPSREAKPSPPPDLASFDEPLAKLDAIHATDAYPEPGHSFEARDELLDPRVSLTIRRIRLALPSVLAAGDRARLAGLDLRLAHLRFDLEELAKTALGLSLTLEKSIRLGPRREEIQDRRDELLQELAALSQQLEPQAAEPETPVPLVRMWALGMDARDGDRCGEAALRLARITTRCRDGIQLSLSLVDLDRVVHLPGGIVRATRPELQQIVRLLLTSAATLRPAMGEFYRAQLALAATTHALRNCTRRAESPTTDGLAVIDEGLAALRRHAEGLPPASRFYMGQTLHRHSAERHRFLQTTDPGLDARLDAAKALAAELMTGWKP
jgi:serine/threonine protein kinase